MKAPSPLLGFNNNVRHKGRVFHIQTEDSGVRHPHVITHLFADGGRILKTTKTSYAEHVGQDRMAERVRAMMQDQHKAMFIALRDGQYDYLFDESAAPPNTAQAATDAAKAPKPSAAVQPVVSPAPEPQVASPPPRPPIAPPSRPQTAAPPAIVRPAPSPVPLAPPAPDASKRLASRPRLDLDPGAIHGALPADPEASIDLDLDALERAAAEAQTPFYQQIQDLPPPPAAVLGNKRTSTGGYSVRSSPPEGGSPASPGRYSADHTPPRRAPTPPTPPTASLPLATPGRYAPSRPASIFATTRPQEGSLFGENLISEKSLDEVILSYLADDLDPDKK